MAIIIRQTPPPEGGGDDGHEPKRSSWRTVGEHDELVPARHRRPLFPHERDGVVDDWAARIFHGHLFTTARVQSLIDVEIGRGLARLRRIDGFAVLGYARMGDYVRETLGIGVRWAQQLARLADALDRLPALDRALAAGALTPCKALALLPVVSATNVSAWCTFAERASVRALRAAVREGSDPPAVETEGACASDGGSDAAGDGGVAGSGGAAGDGNAADDGDAADDLVPLALRLPAVVADLLDHTLDVVRRSAGGQIPRREAFALMLAELAATIPLDETVGDAVGDAGGVGGADSAERGARAAGDRGARTRRLEEMLERITNAWAFLHDPSARIRLDDDLAARAVPPDAFAIDAHLTRLTALRQRRHLDIGALLYNVCLLGLPRKLHFASLGHYARERLGLSGRSAREIHWACRRLHRFKKIRAAYEAAEITWSHVRLLLRIAHPGTEEAWIARARRVTFRRFELEVAAAHRRRDIDPMGWARDGGPPPLSHEPPYAERSPVRPGHGLWFDPFDASDASGTSGTSGTSDTPCTSDTSPTSHLRRTFSHARWRWVRLELPPDTVALWRRARATLMRRLEQVGTADDPPSPDPARRSVTGPPPERSRTTHPQEWHCIVELCRHVLETWERRTLATTAEKVVARDGECCTVPGCTSRARNESHHIIFRSRLGSTDAPSNLTAVCAGHHAHGLHAGRITCEGSADEGIRWALGVRTGQAPRRRYLGDVRTGDA